MFGMILIIYFIKVAFVNTCTSDRNRKMLSFDKARKTK